MAKFKGYKALKKKDLETLFEKNYVVTEDGDEINYDDETAYITEEEQPISLPLGLIFPSSVYSDSPALHLADGTSLLQTGIYKDFCNWVKQRKVENSGNVKTCTIEEYATEMATYGQCGKYVINDTEEDLTSGNYTVLANSIKLPTITEFVASNNGGQEIGLAQLDEFKSHVHGVDVERNNHIVVTDGSGNWAATYSNSNTSAAGGEETRPKNIRYPHYIVVATSINDSAAISAEPIVSFVNEQKENIEQRGNISHADDLAGICNGYFTPGSYTTGGGFTTAVLKLTATESTSHFNTNASDWYVEVRKEGFYRISAQAYFRCSNVIGLLINIKRGGVDGQYETLVNHWSSITGHSTIPCETIVKLWPGDIIYFDLYGESSSAVTAEIPGSIGLGGMRGWQINYLGLI